MAEIKAAGKYRQVRTAPSRAARAPHPRLWHFARRRHRAPLNTFALKRAAATPPPQEGKTYVMQDGDIVHWMFNVTAKK
jgi:hypothetical protein